MAALLDKGRAGGRLKILNEGYVTLRGCVSVHGGTPRATLQESSWAWFKGRRAGRAEHSRGANVLPRQLSQSRPINWNTPICGQRPTLSSLPITLAPYNNMSNKGLGKQKRHLITLIGSSRRPFFRLAKAGDIGRLRHSLRQFAGSDCTRKTLRRCMDGRRRAFRRLWYYVPSRSSLDRPV